MPYVKPMNEQAALKNATPITTLIINYINLRPALLSRHSMGGSPPMRLVALSASDSKVVVGIGNLSDTAAIGPAFAKQVLKKLLPDCAEVEQLKMDVVKRENENHYLLERPEEGFTIVVDDAFAAVAKAASEKVESKTKEVRKVWAK